MVPSGLGRFDADWIMSFWTPLFYSPLFCMILASSLPPDIESEVGMDVYVNIFGSIVLNWQLCRHPAKLCRCVYTCAYTCMDVRVKGGISVTVSGK